MYITIQVKEHFVSHLKLCKQEYVLQSLLYIFCQYWFYTGTPSFVSSL